MSHAKNIVYMKAIIESTYTYFYIYILTLDADASTVVGVSNCCWPPFCCVSPFCCDVFVSATVHPPVANVLIVSFCCCCWRPC